MPEHTRPPDRRTQILIAAAKVFSEHGFAGAAIDAIAAEAGIAKGSVYNYFKSKEELFVQVFTASFTRDEERLIGNLGELASALGRIDMLFDEWYGHLAQYTHEGTLVLEFWLWAARQGESVLTAAFHELNNRWRDRISGILADGVASGELRSDLDPQTAATVMMATFNGLIIRMILEGAVVVDEEFLHRLKRLFHRALAMDNGGEGCEEGAS